MHPSPNESGDPRIKPYDIIDIRSAEFHQFELVTEVFKGLQQEPKTIPTLVLYDDRGLQLFDEITYLEEYYLTNAEINVLENYVDEIQQYVKDGSALIELGAGSLRKTQLVLKAVEKKCKNITYYALDVMQQELEKSLASLGSFSNIRLVGLLGTYEDGIAYCSKLPPEQSKIVMWIGSSIGNYNREDGAAFLRSYRDRVMNAGDMVLLGVDRRNDPELISVAYNDPRGVTREFIMNGLDHINNILGHNFIDRNQFEYVSYYNEKQGRHEAYYRSLCDQTLSHKDQTFHIAKNEMINVEYSYKYDVEELISLFETAGLSHAMTWTETEERYDLHLLYRGPFFCPKPKGSVPTREEWEELWSAWDTVTTTMIPTTMHLQKPIDLRHPCIFYFGHIPAFLDIQLSHCLGEPRIRPDYGEIFERGIDPDMDDPSHCHPHSRVPDEWPAAENILEYRDQVRTRLLHYLESEKKLTRRAGRYLWMAFEHEAMHLETFLYMLLQSPETLPPKGVVPPIWAQTLLQKGGEDQVDGVESTKVEVPPPSALISIEGGQIQLGHEDSELLDDEAPLELPFGWDNENPVRSCTVAPFRIQTRPVTNAEYLRFLIATVNKDYPQSWVPVGEPSKFRFKVRTVFGAVPLETVSEWPVTCSQAQAEAYADWVGMRLPSEEEWVMARDVFERKLKEEKSLNSDEKEIEGVKVQNIGFRYWHPTPVADQFVSDVWEWTSTLWERFQGFKPSELYPGYSADFFDRKHVVCLGGSWATHPRIAHRRSFRNWYQKGYPYVFAGFRLCSVE
ncbi:uncharacterized protein VTP21DRAFT_2085 [Calcarisporiella thermophila]|uniref:uncharacterized protein n=1 Tax=Calcarisporiella thermophila TaxID=911321 RepID=UPI003743F45B